MDSKMKLKYSIYIFLSLLMVGCGTSKPINVKLTTPDLYIRPENILKKQIKIALEELKISPSIPPDNIIGRAKTGMFNVSADLVADEPINVIVTKALKKGFEQAGFKVVDLKDSNYMVEGSIEKFWVDEHATGWSFEYAKAYVRYDLIIRKPNGGTVWANTIEKFKVSRKSMDSSSSIIPTLTLALRDSVESIFEDQSFWKAFLK
jgi:hypothetical protein